MAILTNKTIASTYQSILNIGTADNQTLDGTLRVVEDGAGNNSVLYLATDSALISGNGTRLYFYDADGGEYISASNAGVLNIAGGAQINLTTPNIDINGTTVCTIDNSNTSNGVVINATTSGSPVSIGHTTSVTTINDELDVTGTVDINDTTDSSSKTSGALKVDGGVGIAKKLYVGTDLDVDGTANLDAVDIDGAVQLDSTFTVGVNDTGHDVKFFGATSGQYMLWDESADELVLAGDTKLSFHDAAGGEYLQASSDGVMVFNAGTSIASTTGTYTITNANGEAFKVGSAGVVINDSGVAANDFRIESDSNANIFFVDSGNNKVGMGTNSPEENLHIAGSDNTDCCLLITSYDNDTAAQPPRIRLYRARGTGASPALVQAGDYCGSIEFGGYLGSTGDDFYTYYDTGASIVSIAGSSPSDSQEDIPMDLLFNTSPDGSGSNQERLRITSAGKVGINTGSPDNLFEIQETAGDTKMTISCYSDGGTTHSGELYFKRSHSDTAGTNVVTENGTQLGRILWQGTNDASGGDAFASGAAITATQRGSISGGGNYVPTELSFITYSTTAGNTVCKMNEDGALEVLGPLIGTVGSVTTYSGNNGTIPITQTYITLDAGGVARSGLTFAGAGVAGQFLAVKNVGGEGLTFNNTEGTALLRGVHADHDTMQDGFMGLFISDGTYWNLIAGGITTEPDVGLAQTT